MKSGDIFLAAIRKRNLAASLLQFMLSPEYIPEWWYWEDYARCYRN